MEGWKMLGRKERNGRFYQMTVGVLSALLCLNLVQVGAFAAGDSAEQIGPYVECGLDGSVVGTAEGPRKAVGDTLTLEKRIAGTEEENVFDITLEVATKEWVEEVTTAPEAAVVLVLDTSYNMGFTERGCGYQCYSNGGHSDSLHENGFDSIWPEEEGQRLAKAKDAACTLLKDFAEEANGGRRMVSVVRFDDTASRVVDWTDVAETGNLTEAKSGIRNISLGYDGVNVDDALQMAGQLLGEQAVQGISNRFVVLLTGGTATRCNDSSVDCFTAAQLSATAVKTDDQATLFTLAFTTDEDFCYSKEGRCEKTEWHYHSTADCERNGYEYGEQGRVEGGKFIPHNVDECSWPCDCTSYWFEAHEGTSDTIDVTVGDWLSNDIASPGCGKNAVNGETIVLGPMEGGGPVKKHLEPSQVLDPMGNFILYRGVVGEGTEERPVTFDESTKTMTWDLSRETPLSDGADPATYTYTLTYRVKLDTAAVGFQEKELVPDGQPTEVARFYPTNGPTTLTYKDGAGTLQTAHFYVPTVKGTVPEAEYTINFYLENGEDGSGKTYRLDEPATLHGQAKLHTRVEAPEGYAVKYDKGNYRYVKGVEAITIGPGENVLNLYYDKIDTSATVHCHYTDILIKPDGTEETHTVTDPQPPVGNLHAGELYRVEPLPERTYDGKIYEYDKTAANQLEIASLSRDGTENILHLYYTRTEDSRKVVTATVQHVLQDYGWVKGEDGLQRETLIQEVTEEEPITGLRAHTTFTATPKDYPGYTLVTPEADRTRALTENEAENVMSLLYERRAPEPQRVTITVTHHYTLTQTQVVDGKAETTTPEEKTVKGSHTFHAGDDVTLTEQPLFEDGKTYEGDPSNLEKLSLTNLPATPEAREVDLYYTRTEAPAKVPVTVCHEYYDIRTYDLEEDATIIDTVNTPVEDQYVGVRYTAALVGKPGYTFAGTEEDRTVIVTAESPNKIVLRYERRPGTDQEGSASIDVRHLYTTHLETLVDNAPGYRDSTEPVQGMTFEGWEGDTFIAEPILNYNGADYELVTPEGDLTRTLTAGTNDTIDICYRREASDLVETSYTVNYEYRTYKMAVDDTGVAGYGLPEVETVTPELPAGPFYVGQQVPLPDGSREGFQAAGTTPGTVQTLSPDAASNAWTLIYDRYEPLPKVTVKVDHVYTTTTILEDGRETTETQRVEGAPVEKYQGETVAAQPCPGDFTYESCEATPEVTPTQDPETGALTFPATEDTTVTFHYTKTVDKSRPATYSVQHVYKTLDKNGDRETVRETEPLTGRGYAGDTVTTAAALGEGFTLVEATWNGQPLDIGGAPNIPIVLAEGENQVVYTYERTIDTRQDAAVTVTHVYEVLDAATGETREEARTGEVVTTRRDESGIIANGVYVGARFTATPVPTFGDEEYTQKTADLTITLAETGNQLLLRYERVIHAQPIDPDPTPTRPTEDDNDEEDKPQSTPEPSPSAPVSPTEEIQELAVPQSALPADVGAADWYTEGVEYVLQMGLMVGPAPEAFAPEGEATRAMAVTALYRLDRSGEAESEDGTAPWYEAGMTWAAANGITDTRTPEAPLTREELAVLLYRYAVAKGCDTTATGDLETFRDGDTVHSEAEAAMSWAVGVGLFQGVGNDLLCPTATATRAQIATVLMRFCLYVVK